MLRPGRSVRTQVLAIALVPCAALVVTGTAVVVNLADEANVASRWSKFVATQVDPVVIFALATQDERTVSLAAVTGDQQARAELPVERAKVDASLVDLSKVTVPMQKLNPQAVTKATPAFQSLFARLPLVRQAIDVRHMTAAEVDDFYTRLIGVLAMGFEGLAHYTPDSANAAEEMTSVDLVQMADLHARAVAVATAAIAGGPLRPEQRRTVAQLVGGYRNQLNELIQRFTDQDQQRYQRLTTSAAWHTAVDAEDQLTEKGSLPISFDDWRSAEQSVSAELMGLFRDHALYAHSLVTKAASRTLNRAVIAGVAVPVVAITVFVFGLLLANRLIRRLQSLRSKTLHLANETLPSIIQRLHDGEEVDVDAETTALETGADEIGQVAEAFATAQRTAVAAAVAEARTRDGFNRVFVDIAYRSQVIVRRQMDVLDVAEAKQHDPEHLELLFRLDHLATRARRNAENLLILGGAQPGRRWHQPVALEEIVRSAASETQDFARMSAIRLPAANVQGRAVADLVHLLAELIDNAASFSPPQTHVGIHGNVVGRGVVVVIEDQGLGIAFEERERLNELLRDPPDFQEITLAGQRHLGLFVVGRLAKRHEITVTLQESAYGGVKAIVLIPARMLDPGAPGGDIFEPTLTAEWTGARPALDGAPRPASDPVPRLPGHTPPELSAWVSDESAETGRHASTAVEDREPGPATRTRAPLPRRQRFAHLAPELRVDDEPAATDPETPRDSGRPADEIRSSMASFQRGTRRARESNPPANQ